MNNQDFNPPLTQPLLFSFDESITQVELFPAVWKAAENLTSPHQEVRREAVEQLALLNAPRFSPLIAYLLFTRINEPDIHIRSRVIQILGSIYKPDHEGKRAPIEVISHLAYHLSQMRVRQIFALLEACSINPSILDAVEHLINRCPYAGNHLTEILTDRKMPLAVREKAAYIIGRVGFLDAIPALEKLIVRVEARLQGQSSMPFAPPQSQDEVKLLPTVREALHVLQTP
jgi:HEAT repeat protein